MSDLARPSETAGHVLRYALADRILTDVTYDQEGRDWWLCFVFDGWCRLFVMPQAVPTKRNPVPWFEFMGTPMMDDCYAEAEARVVAFAPAPRHVRVSPFRRPWSARALVEWPPDPAGLQAARMLAAACRGRRAHGAFSDAMFERSASADRFFQIGFDEERYLTFDFNPPGERRYQADWIALFNEAEDLKPRSDVS